MGQRHYQLMKFINRLAILSPFWILSSCYLLIPLFQSPVPAPQFFIDIDSAIPFIWWMIIPYYFYYISLFLPLMISDLNMLKSLVNIAMILLLGSYSIFIIWPISCAPVLMSIQPNPLSVLYGFVTFSWLQQNAFPSVHVVISTFIGLIFAKQIPELKWLFWIGIFLVFLATFFTKQHFIADSIAGLIIGIFGYRIWFKKVKIKPEG